MKIEIFCPSCAKAGIRRKLMEVDSEARGLILPWCKACRKNVEIELTGAKNPDIKSGIY